MSEPDTTRASHAPATAPAEPAPFAQPDGGSAALPAPVAIVGAGRAGTALAAALRASGLEVDGPARRGEYPRGEILLLCVPDAEIEAAASAAARASDARFVGHVSGATPLSAVAPAEAAGAEVFGLHPLQTLTGGGASELAGAGCAVAGSTPRAAAVATALAWRLGMRPFAVDDARRASYHAAASIASNFLVTLEAAAEAVAAEAGFSPEDARALLAPLVRQTVENWAERGAEAALTGPVARGDERTVSAQRAAVADADPSLVPLFDALVERTRALAGRSAAARADLKVAALPSAPRPGRRMRTAAST